MNILARRVKFRFSGYYKYILRSYNSKIKSDKKQSERSQVPIDSTKQKNSVILKSAALSAAGLAQVTTVFGG